MAEALTPPGTQFRWRYQDDAVGEDWSDWHNIEGDCAACCHGGPHDGEHQQFAGFYDEAGVMDWHGHTTCAPLDPHEVLPVEWAPDEEASR